MTDHSEVRRDAEDYITAPRGVWTTTRRIIASLLDAHAAEQIRAQQAERERDEWEANSRAATIRFAKAESELDAARTALHRCRSDMHAKVLALQARLASVPALVEALRYIGDESHAMPPTAEGMRKRARAALTVYEQSQGKP